MLRFALLIGILVVLTPQTTIAQVSDGNTLGDCSPIIGQISGNVYCNFQERQNVESFLSRLRSGVSEEAISYVFGPPVERFELSGSRFVTLWENGDLYFFSITLNSQERIALGIISKIVEPRGPIPLMRMIVGPDNDVVSFDTITLSHIHDCHGSLASIADPRYVFWTLGPCYFGRPGSYFNWEFSFLGFKDCDTANIGDYFDTFVISELNLTECQLNLTPFLVLANFDEELPDNIIAQELLDHMFWTF